MPETLPPAVRAFLREHIDSYEELELLLLLRAEPHAAWSEEALAGRTGLPVDAVAEALRALQRAQCIGVRTHAGEAVRYAPRDAGQAAAIEGLAAAYTNNSLAIIKLMSANAIERVRNAALGTFADAFVVGRKKDE